MNKHSSTVNDGLLRLHAKLTALSEIIGASLENGVMLGHDASFGFHCLLCEMADAVQQLKELNEKEEV